MLIIDKARNPGGRLSTRDHPPFCFDHGAQFLTVKDTEFRQIIQRGLQQGDITVFMHPEKGRVYIGNPVFKPLISRLIKPFNFTQNALVEKIEKHTDKSDYFWRILVKNSKPIFADKIILTMPAPQTYALLPKFLYELRETSLKAEYQPCIATMVGVELPKSFSLNLNKPYSRFEPIWIAKGNISWSIAKWSRVKKNTKTYLSVIIHANQWFSSKHIERDINELAKELWQEWISHVDESAKIDTSVLINHVSYLKGHKWRYAMVSKIPEKWHERTNLKQKIAIAGDWLNGPRIECAWISGRDAANSLLEGL